MSPSSGWRRSRSGGLVGGLGVEDLALVVGVDGALDQPPGLGGGHVAAHLDVLEPVRQRHLGAEEVLQRHPLVAGRDRLTLGRPGLPHRDAEHDHGTDPDEHVRQPDPRGELTSSGAADEQPDGDRDQAGDRAAQGRVAEHVREGVAHLGDLALRLAGDVAVATDQLVRGRRVGLLQPDVDAEQAGALDPYVGQDRAGLEDRGAGQRRLHDRVVARELDRAGAREEQHRRDRGRAHQPGPDVRQDLGDTSPHRRHGQARASEIA